MATYKCVYIYIYMQINRYILICMHMCVFICICKNIYIYIHVYSHIVTYVYIRKIVQTKSFSSGMLHIFMLPSQHLPIHVETIPEVFVWLGSYGGSRPLPATELLELFGSKVSNGLGGKAKMVSWCVHQE